jgi:hypothetical protein
MQNLDCEMQDSLGRSAPLVSCHRRYILALKWPHAPRGCCPQDRVGSLQQRLWTVRDPPPENLVPDNAQQGDEKKTGCNAKDGGRHDSHSGPFTVASMVADQG